jgi:hypothetical protein
MDSNFCHKKVAKNRQKFLAPCTSEITLITAMNITRLLSALVIGSFVFVVSAPLAEARRPSQNNVVITPPPAPVEASPVSPQ